MINQEKLVQAINGISKETLTKDEILQLIKIVSSDNSKEVLKSEGVSLDPNSYTIMKDEKIFRLPKKEFLLLYYFISNKNKVLLRENILRDIWGTDVIVLDRTIDVHIRKIRRVVGSDNLKTKKSVGYGWFEK
jgi:two-component system alkaline phosphatase synthesis response regulator PhoP